MKKLLQDISLTKSTSILLSILLIFLFTNQRINAQCVAVDGEISGNVFLDENVNGENDDSKYISAVLVNAFDKDGNLADHSMSNYLGNYTLDNLDPAETYRIEFRHSPDYYSTQVGADHQTDVRREVGATCDVNFGLRSKMASYGENPDIAVTCFVRGTSGVNTGLETIVKTTNDFHSSTPVGMLATKSTTGSVWGLAYNSSKNEIYSSSFVKQYAALGNLGFDGIYKTSISSPSTTSKFVKLTELGISMTPLAYTDINDCSFSSQVGRTGIGAIDISDDEKTLYVVNISNNSVVAINTVNPEPSNTVEIPIVLHPNHNGKAAHAFALKIYKNKLYVGVTITGEESRKQYDSRVVVMEYDFNTEIFTEVFNTNYSLGFWDDLPISYDSYAASHWLTDIDFINDNQMVIGLSDRIGHKYCDSNSRLDNQHGDILMVYKNAGVWTLESNGSIFNGSVVGQGVGNGDGPNGGEFFGDDYFTLDPYYHNEVALGSALFIPGTNEVIATVFDPETNTHSGGLHRYSALDGSRLGSRTLYTDDYTNLFGKATGFGDVIALAPRSSIEIGNVVWIDAIKNGVQDPSEEVLANITLALYDNNCQKVGETITDSDGHYLFNATNVDLNNDGNMDGLDPYNTYHIVLIDDNFSKSTSSFDNNGEVLVLTDLNSGSASYPDGNDNDADIAAGICSSIDGYPVITLQTRGAGDNDHSFDIGLAAPGNFDLALKKEIVGSEYRVAGNKVTYKISVINQGEIGAQEILVRDLIPAGLMFDETLNSSNWSYENNVAEYTISGMLAPSQTQEIFITLLLKGGFTYEQFINYAEIGSAKDQFGKPGVDVDSTPDLDFTNDEGGVPFQSTDNLVTDNGDIDEDDHDPAAIKIFDLALTKKLVNVQSTYVPGDEVEFEIYVYNQGNVDAHRVRITDYLPKGMIMTAADWDLIGNYYTYIVDVIPAGGKVTIPISMQIDKSEEEFGIVNYAEISLAELEDGKVAQDYDSTADTDKEDDQGGNPYDHTDNETDDNGTIDEDDHDPATYNLQRYDLALAKTVKKTSLRLGDLAEFVITITNQGTIIADEITIVDYIPEGLIFETMNTDWDFDSNTKQASCVISRSNNLLPIGGLQPGEETSISIFCRIADDADFGQIVNYAEIASCKDINGIDRSQDDFDSTPDLFVSNDNGGNVYTDEDNLITDNGSKDEDDHDPAALVVFDSGINSDCICLSNATATNSGQFINEFYILSLAGEDWTIVEATNFSEGLFAADEKLVTSDYTPGANVAVTPFAVGMASDTLVEVDQGGVSFYYIDGISNNGFTPSVTLSNGIEEVTITGNTCSYDPQTITGANGVCIESTTTYCVDEVLGTTYSWDLSANGVITSATDEACVTVLWDATPGSGVLSLEQVNTVACPEYAEMDIQVGIAGGAMACIGTANISLNNQCELEVTADLVLQGDTNTDAVYAVIITDPQGNMLPEPIITGDYIGQSMTVKIMDVCSGNSCWTTINVSDNIAPTLTVADVTVPCYDLASVGIPTGDDNCGGEVIVSLESEEIVALDCEPNTYEVTRIYKGTDESGNESQLYTQLISLERIDVSAIVFPIDRTVADGNPVFCQQFDIDDNGNPAPSTTGVPTYLGQDIFPFVDQYCSFGLSYTDQIVQPNGCVEKVMRTWTAYEWWCDQAIFETFIQEINIADQLAPTFAKPADISMTTNTGQCFASVVLPSVSPEDDCSDVFDVDITYPGGFLNDTNGGEIDFELGDNLVTYTVYDGCLNSSSQTMIVTVVDNTPPTMVCDGNSVISLKADGTAYAPAIVFDDGSNEDCTTLTYEVKRMDNGDPCSLANYTFGPFVEFCCADAGQTVQIILRATDENGNSNECMVNAVIQDKNAPTVTAPLDMTIQCTDEFDANDLAASFGVATATDNCMNPIISEVPTISINSCNVGTITRVFTATDGNGSATDTQVITVENNSVFAESDIVWPLDYTTNESCNAGDLLPENLDPPYDFPVITVDECDQIDIGFQDAEYQTTDNSACSKILRRWMIMNMCDLDIDGMPRMFIYEQTIVITNEVDPEITSSCDPVSSSLNADCFTGDISLSATATDDCTPDSVLQYSLNIDFNNDGSFDYTETGVGGTINYSSNDSLGTHRAVYQWDDRCGNTTNCTQLFTIFNNTPPIAYCADLAVELTPMDTDGDNVVDAEMAFVDVILLGAGSQQPCGFPFTLSYDVEGDSTLASFDCFDLGTNEVTVYVTDENGLQSSCISTVIIQDNNNVDICPTPEDCIVWPDTNLTIDFCVANTDPATIGSETSVTEPCVCDDYDITFADVDVSIPGEACVLIERTWTVTFNCFASPLVYTFVQNIIQLNGNNPVIDSCPGDVNGMSMDASCEAAVVVGLPVVNTDCSFGITITNNSPFATSSTGAASGTYPVGTTTVIYTATDACGNASTCQLDVIIGDTGAPICNTQDITVSIPASGGTVTIADDAVDDNSTDECGVIVSYSTTPNTFSCDNLGDNTVVMTVTDQSGNSSTCTAIVTVEDLVAPICSAQSLTVTLFTDGVFTIPANLLDDGSVDTCGTIVSFSAVPPTLDCSNIGVNDVTLVVTDNNGNTSECATTVTLVDGVDPICVAQDITITLDNTGSYTLTGAEVDGGSSDVCGVGINLSVTPDMFDCDDLGDNTVTLTVTDDAGNTSECTAVVTVTENVAPLCMAGTANITLFGNTTVTLPASTIDLGSTDECGVVDTVFITPNMFDCDDIGSNIVILTVVDDSGNSSTCEGTVNVIDGASPNAIAMDITVTIGTSGIVIVNGIDLDDGSNDPCGEIVNYMVTPDTFDCNDLGDNPVVFKVTDEAGNTDTANATVTVISNDSLMCLAQNIMVFLDENGEYDVDPSEVDGGSTAPCGSTVTLSLSDTLFTCNDLSVMPDQTVMLIVTDDVTGDMDTCSAIITLADTLDPEVIAPIDLTFDCNQDLTDPAIFGIVDFNDNCMGGLVMDTTVVDNRNFCGIGTIELTYMATDFSGNTGTDIQIVTVEPVPGSTFDETNITWPDTTLDVTDCSMISPEELMSFPEIDSVGLSCFILSINHVDMSIGMSTMCLDTVQRTWTVIDSCQLDGTGAGVFTFNQFIFIDDSDIPEIQGLPTDTTLFVNQDSCSLFIDFSAAFVEDCSMNITYTNNSPSSESPDSLDISGIYDLGITTVTITAEDACGNADTFMINIELIDTLGPMVNCIKVFSDITDDGTVTVTPLDFIDFQNDNCSDSINISAQFILNFTEDDTDPTDNPTANTLTADCDDLGVSIVYLIFFDESGNFGFCAAQWAVDDPDGFCGPVPEGNIVSGNTVTAYGQAVTDTEVSIDGNSQQFTVVDNDGGYSFGNISGIGAFSVEPYNNENPTKGVSTLDILIIQKHIMSMDELDSPYDLIAADANANGKVTGSDIIVIQKLILGDLKEFPDNTSFRFLDKNLVFLDEKDPFAQDLPGYSSHFNITGNVIQDFIGIKIGDVNGSYQGLAGTGDETEVNGIHQREDDHVLYMDDLDLRSASGLVEIPVYSPSYDALQALEMTLKSDLEIVGIKAGTIDINDNDYAVSNLGRKLKVSWVNSLPIDVAENSILFKIIVKSNEAIFAADHIEMAMATNEFYDTNYNIADLRFADQDRATDDIRTTLNQNTPNPWTNETLISFDMMREAHFTLNFFNAEGKQIHTINGFGTEGYNEVKVTKSDLGGHSGVIIYEFLSHSRKITRRMMLIE